MDLKQFLGLTQQEEKKKIKERVKKDGPIVFRDTLKKERKAKEKRDFFDKELVLEILKEYCMIVEILENEELDTRQRDILITQRKEIRDWLIIQYYHLAKHLTKHSHFRGYDEQTKKDLIQESISRAMSIGKEGKSNYGVEYFTRFNFEEHDNVFAFWTQQIKTFFYQQINENNDYKNIQEENLEIMMEQAEYDNKNIHGCPGAKGQIGDIKNENNMK